jgi:hypothetical protein
MSRTNAATRLIDHRIPRMRVLRRLAANAPESAASQMTVQGQQQIRNF